MLLVQNVTKVYKKNDKKILDNINFELKDGDALAIVGANGSGKTTLVEIIAGVLEPTEGKIIYKNGDSLIEDKKFLEENIGIQFQSGTWPPTTRANDLLNFFVGKNWKKDEYIQSLIEVFEIADLLPKRINNASGGEQQRFNCFLSVLKKPKILILDELITGLDLKMQIKIANYFHNIRKTENLTIINVSHIPEEVEEMCDRFLVLKEGKIFRDILTKDIIKEYGSARKMMTKFYENNSK